MIFKLILKDIQAYKTLVFLQILLPMVVANSLFNLKFYQAGGFIVTASMVIAVAYSAVSFSEKKQNIEILIRSLPVTKSALVFSKYLTAGVIFICGILLYMMGAYLIRFIYVNPRASFNELFSLKALFIALFFISIHASIFIPTIFKLRLPGMIFTFVIGLAAAVLLTHYFYTPYQSSFKPYFAANDFFQIKILSLVIFIQLSLSVLISIIFYHKSEQV